MSTQVGVCRACRDDASVTHVTKVFRQLSLCQQCVAHLIGPRRGATDDDDSGNLSVLLESPPKKRQANVASAGDLVTIAPTALPQGTNDDGDGAIVAMVYATLDLALAVCETLEVTSELVWLFYNVKYRRMLVIVRQERSELAEAFRRGWEAVSDVPLYTQEIAMTISQEHYSIEHTPFSVRRAHATYVQQRLGAIVDHTAKQLGIDATYKVVAPRGIVENALEVINPYLPNLEYQVRHLHYDDDPLHKFIGDHTDGQRLVAELGRTKQYRSDMIYLNAVFSGCFFAKVATKFSLLEGPRSLKVKYGMSEAQRWAAMREAHFSDTERARLVNYIEHEYDRLLSESELVQQPPAPELMARSALYWRPPYVPRVGSTLWHGTGTPEVVQNSQIELNPVTFFSTDMGMSLSYASGMHVNSLLQYRVINPLPTRCVSVVRFVDIVGSDDGKVRDERATTIDILEPIWTRMFGYSHSYFTRAAQLVCQVWHTVLLVHMVQGGNVSAAGENGLEVAICQPQRYVSQRLSGHVYWGFSESSLMQPSFDSRLVDKFMGRFNDVGAVRTSTWQQVRDQVWVTIRRGLNTYTHSTPRMASVVAAAYQDIAASRMVIIHDLAALDGHLRNLITQDENSLGGEYTLMSYRDAVSKEQNTVRHYGQYKTKAKAGSSRAIEQEKAHKRLEIAQRNLNAYLAELSRLRANITTHQGLLMSERSYAVLFHNKPDNSVGLAASSSSSTNLPPLHLVIYPHSEPEAYAMHLTVR